jgi:putative serine protease PepD
VDVAKTISDELIANGRATHAFFGLQTVPVPESESGAAGSGGLFVAGVVPNGPAEKAGLQQGDVITSIDGKPAVSNVQLQELTLTRNPGDQVAIEYNRDGHTASATVTLAAQP